MSTNNDLMIWKDKTSLMDIQKVFGQDLTESEFKTFCQMGIETGLNPFLKEIWAVKYDKTKPAQIFIGRDGYRKVAQSQSDYRAHQVDAVYSNDVFQVHNGSVTHTYTMKDRGALVGAYCLVYKDKMQVPFYNFVSLKEYNLHNKIWNEKPETMIKKVVESQTLRMAWQGLFANTYDESEDWKNEDIDKEPKNISKVNQDNKSNIDIERTNLIDRINTLSIQLGYVNIDKCTYKLSKGGYKSIDEVPTEKLPNFIEALNQTIAARNANIIPNSIDHLKPKREHLKTLSEKANINIEGIETMVELELDKSISDMQSFIDGMEDKAEVIEVDVITDDELFNVTTKLDSFKNKKGVSNE